MIGKALESKGTDPSVRLTSVKKVTDASKRMIIGCIKMNDKEKMMNGILT